MGWDGFLRFGFTTKSLLRVAIGQHMELSSLGGAFYWHIPLYHAAAVTDSISSMEYSIVLWAALNTKFICCFHFSNHRRKWLKTHSVTHQSMLKLSLANTSAETTCHVIVNTVYCNQEE